MYRNTSDDVISNYHLYWNIPELRTTDSLAFQCFNYNPLYNLCSLRVIYCFVLFSSSRGLQFIIKHRNPPLAGFSATAPDAGYSNASASDANYSNAGTSEAVKACNRGLAHVQKKCIVLVLYNNYVL